MTTRSGVVMPCSESPCGIRTLSRGVTSSPECCFQRARLMTASAAHHNAVGPGFPAVRSMLRCACARRHVSSQANGLPGELVTPCRDSVRITHGDLARFDVRVRESPARLAGPTERRRTTSGKATPTSLNLTHCGVSLGALPESVYRAAQRVPCRLSCCSTYGPWSG